MNNLTRVFLVLLRLAIGWHFLFEGVEKVESLRRGPTETSAEKSRPFSSAGYLRESSGPFAEFFRAQVGDPDALLLERVTVTTLEPGQNPADVPARQRISPALEKNWNEGLERFAAHYELDAQQRQAAETKLQEAKDKVVKWLLDGEWEDEKSFQAATVKVKKKTPQRTDEYQQKLSKIREAEAEELSAFDRDVLRAKLRTMKAELAKMRSEFQADLDKPFSDMLSGLVDADSSLTADQKAKGPLPAPGPTTKQKILDYTVSWGLVAVGVCLLIGLLTRTSCLAGAAFLLTLYLAMPPFPWLPENIKAEGHYLFVNKNLIEMLALLALATTRSGFWVGIDGLLRFFFPWNWGRRPVPQRDSYAARRLPTYATR